MQVYYLFHTDNSCQFAWACYSGPIDNHYPKDDFWRFFWRYPRHITGSHTSKNPIDNAYERFHRLFFKELGTSVLYTNATSATKKDWTHHRLSTQQSELLVINQRLSAVSQPPNISTDSVSCVQTAPLLETARLKPHSWRHFRASDVCPTMSPIFLYSPYSWSFLSASDQAEEMSWPPPRSSGSLLGLLKDLNTPRQLALLLHHCHLLVEFLN